jgi:hypothetical protein
MKAVESGADPSIILPTAGAGSLFVKKKRAAKKSSVFRMELLSKTRGRNCARIRARTAYY